jgi:short-subunit dehydrogenase
MKTIIITGSGKGIGKETSIQAAKSGINVIAISRNTESLKNIKNIVP